MVSRIIPHVYRLPTVENRNNSTCFTHGATRLVVNRLEDARRSATRRQGEALWPRLSHGDGTAPERTARATRKTASTVLTICGPCPPLAWPSWCHPWPGSWSPRAPTETSCYHAGMRRRRVVVGIERTEMTIEPQSTVEAHDRPETLDRFA